MNYYCILIADDEAIECTALELLLKNTFSNIQILPSVSNGIDFISSVRQNHPDIAIVDINMPGLNGLDALDLIRSKNPNMKIIIHSAYSEFTYAKRALSLNAFDYIVKPIQKPIFIETMKKVFEALDSERKKHSSEETIHQLTGEVTRLVENDLMSSILLGTIEEHTATLFLRSLSQEYFGGFLVTVRLIDTPVWTSHQMEQLLFTLNQVCLCLGKSYRHDFILYIIPDKGIGESNYQQWTRNLLKLIKGSFLFGVSTWKFTLEELPDALKESNSILLGKQHPDIYFFEYTIPISFYNIFSEKKEILSGFILSGKIQTCCEEIHSIFQHAASMEIPLVPLQIYTAYFLLFVYDQLNCHFSLYLESQLQISWQEFLLCTSYNELDEKLCSAIQHLNYCMNRPMNKSSEYVNHALLYINKMYSQNIALEDIAHLVGISPFYLSRLLKQEINKTFVEVLTEVRVSEALRLLQNPQKTIREIGESVGYVNTTYFYKVFKKQTGMTIGEVRRYL